MAERSLVKVESGAIQEAQTQAQPLMVTPEYIENTSRSLALLRDMVHNVLQSGRDYGTVPGISSEFLWDPGASTIISSFNCHPGQRRIISQVDNGKKIAFVVEVPIISNATQTEVGSGIGAAQTNETKYKYRWESNPKNWGYSEEAIKTLKTRDTKGYTEYRIINPEHDELLNTIVKMASKRAEVDGAMSLPGVASALRELMDGKGKGRQSTKSNKGKGEGEVDDNSPRWTAFWSQAKILLEKKAEEEGIEISELAHSLLRVQSMKDYLKKEGKTLDGAIIELSDKLGENQEVKKEKKRDLKTIKKLDDLFAACEIDFGMGETEVLSELNAGSRDDIIHSPSECYVMIASVR